MIATSKQTTNVNVMNNETHRDVFAKIVTLRDMLTSIIDANCINDSTYDKIDFAMHDAHETLCDAYERDDE